MKKPPVRKAKANPSRPEQISMQITYRVHHCMNMLWILQYRTYLKSAAHLLLCLWILFEITRPLTCMSLPISTEIYNISPYTRSWTVIIIIPSTGHLQILLLKSSNFKSLSANSTKWSNSLKQFVGYSRRIVWVCLAIFWGWRLKN